MATLYYIVVTVVNLTKIVVLMDLFHQEFILGRDRYLM